MPRQRGKRRDKATAVRHADTQPVAARLEKGCFRLSRYVWHGDGRGPPTPSSGRWRRTSGAAILLRALAANRIPSIASWLEGGRSADQTGRLPARHRLPARPGRNDSTVRQPGKGLAKPKPHASLPRQRRASARLLRLSHSPPRPRTAPYLVAKAQKKRGRTRQSRPAPLHSGEREVSPAICRPRWPRLPWRTSPPAGSRPRPDWHSPARRPARGSHRNATPGSCGRRPGRTS